MATNQELEKRIETLEREVQHLKAVLQYQMKIKKKWSICELQLLNGGIHFVMNKRLSDYAF